MIELIEGALRFPTVVLTALLGIVLVYWSLVFIGLLDIDLLSFGGDVGVDADVTGDGLSASSGMARASGLGAIDFAAAPVSVIASVWVLAAWTGTYVMSALLGPAAATLVWGASLLVGGSLVSLLLTALVLRPFRRLFATVPALSKASLIGRTCTVTTLRVSDRHGQAEVDDGAAGVLIQIRASEPEAIRKGSTAVIYDYVEAEDVFLVKPLPPDLGLAQDE